MQGRYTVTVGENDVFSSDTYITARRTFESFRDQALDCVGDAAGKMIRLRQSTGVIYEFDGAKSLNRRMTIHFALRFLRSNLDDAKELAAEDTETPDFIETVSEESLRDLVAEFSPKEGGQPSAT